MDVLGIAAVTNADISLSFCLRQWFSYRHSCTTLLGLPLQLLAWDYAANIAQSLGVSQRDGNVLQLAEYNSRCR